MDDARPNWMTHAKNRNEYRTNLEKDIYFAGCFGIDDETDITTSLVTVTDNLATIRIQNWRRKREGITEWQKFEKYTKKHLAAKKGKKMTTKQA